MQQGPKHTAGTTVNGGQASEPSALVLQALTAWERRDFGQMFSLFADDATFLNAPLGTTTIGKDAIRRMVEEAMTRVTELKFDLRKIVADSSVVVTERVDWMRFGEVISELPVAGFFEFDAGLIVSWREYYDRTPIAKLLDAPQDRSEMPSRGLGQSVETPSRASGMQVVVSETRCAGHGRCHANAPEVFALDDYGFNSSRGRGPIPIPERLQEVAWRGAESCPERAISVSAD